MGRAGQQLLRRAPPEAPERRLAPGPRLHLTGARWRRGRRARARSCCVRGPVLGGGGRYVRDIWNRVTGTDEGNVT